MSSEDANSSEFVVCTNNLTMSGDCATGLYKNRWKIETNFKLLKSNFDVREPVKTSNCKNPSKYIEYKVGLAFSLCNITTELQNASLVSDGRHARFCRCAAEVRNLCKKVIDGTLEENCFASVYSRLMRHLSNKPDESRKHGGRNHKRGRYTSKYRIDQSNSASL